MTHYIVNNSCRDNLQNTKSEVRSNVAQLLAVCIKNTLLLSFGMTLGFPTILIPGLQQQDSDDSFNLSRETISWIGKIPIKLIDTIRMNFIICIPGSINLICIPVGCALSGLITESIGRKKCMQLVNIPFLCAWIVFKFTSSIYLIFIALCLTGLSGGLLEAPVCIYLIWVSVIFMRQSYF